MYTSRTGFTYTSIWIINETALLRLKHYFVRGEQNYPHFFPSVQNDLSKLFANRKQVKSDYLTQSGTNNSFSLLKSSSILILIINDFLSGPKDSPLGWECMRDWLVTGIFLNLLFKTLKYVCFTNYCKQCLVFIFFLINFYELATRTARKDRELYNLTTIINKISFNYLREN